MARVVRPTWSELRDMDLAEAEAVLCALPSLDDASRALVSLFTKKK